MTSSTQNKDNHHFFKQRSRQRSRIIIGGDSTQATSHLRSRADSNHNSGNMSPLEKNGARNSKRGGYASKSHQSLKSHSSDGEDPAPNKKLNKSDVKVIRRKKSYDNNMK